MIRLIPTSIAGRTIAVLVAGMALSHVLSLGAHQLDLLNKLGLTDERHLAERIVMIQRVIDEAPSTERDRTAHTLSAPSIEVHWSPLSLLVRSGTVDERAGTLYHRIKELIPELGDGQLRMSYADESLAGRSVLSSAHHILQLSLQLADTTWVNMSVTTLGSGAHDSADFLVSTTLMAVAIIVLAIASVRIVTAPLRALARAAERLGTDVGGAPLPDTGPKEVRQATHALNRLQGRIRKLIGDRTQMLAAISHDLKTPITRLRLRAELIEDDEQRNKMLADLDEMESMIGSTLAFLREDADKEDARVIDLAAILETICDDMADAGHDVNFAGLGHATLRGKHLALKRAFTNLIDNACKYGSSVRVELTASASHLRVTIDDSGPGIPDAEKEKVFAPFYRVENSRSRSTGGTGLGLTVARSIVRAHGGDVVLSDRPEGGLRVNVRLPTPETTAPA